MHGILDGISSLHSWMKNQNTTVNALARRAGGGMSDRRVARERTQTYDEVSMSFNFKHLSLYSQHF